MPYLLNHQDVRTEKKNPVFGIRVFSRYSAILPSKEEIHICLDGVVNRETVTNSLPETFSGREAALPSLPRAAHTAQGQDSRQSRQ